MTANTTTARHLIISEITDQLERAYAKHGREPWSRHEFAAILREEFDEMWDAVKQDLPIEHVMREVMQIACVCIRFAETGPKKFAGRETGR